MQGGKSNLDSYVTAVSAYPLPDSEVLRHMISVYLAADRRPGDVLRDLADAIDRLHEANQTSPAIGKAVHKRSIRITAEQKQKLKALSLATGLRHTSLIRAAIDAYMAPNGSLKTKALHSRSALLSSR